MKEGITTEKIVVGLVMAVLMAWLSMMQSTVNDVIALKPQIERIQEDVADNEKWTQDWESGGILGEDIKQNERIADLEQDVSDIKSLDLPSRLASLEVKLEGIDASLQEIKVLLSK